MFKQILRKIFRPRFKYQPLVRVLVFKDRLRNNLRQFQDKFPAVKFAPVLKSNAYGHGLVEVGKILDDHNLPFFVVDSFYEALVLRSSGIATEILVIGYSTLEHLANTNLKDVAFTIVSFGQLEELVKNLSRPTRVHLKIDTGMHRQGVLPEQLEQAISLIQSNPNLLVEGVCSHLADADGKSREFTEKQIAAWNRVVQKCRSVFPRIKYWHLSNSAGTVFSPEIQANVVRLGIGLYGFDQTGKIPGLKPCLALETLVAGIKDIQPGDFVGYNITFKALAPMKIATLPAGYYEGVDRRLSNLGQVQVQGRYCKILGRVSMNLTVVDVSSVPGARVGDKATVISPESGDENSAAALAKVCNTITYDILVRIPQHLKREVVNE